jgi:hypothetical protein
MGSTYSDLKFELMTTGENDTTWGDKTNTNLTAVQEAITGSASVAFSDANVILTLTNSSSSQTARNLRLNLTGTATTGYNLIVPAIEKQYIVNNGTDGTITVKNATGTGVAIPAGAATIVFNDGTNVVQAMNYLSSFSFGGVLPVSSGGTGASTLTGILKGNGTSAFTTATAGTDFVAPGTATTFTARQTFNGSATDVGAKLQNAVENVTISATAATGTINYDVLTQSVLYYTTNASGNWTLNVRGSGSTSLNTLMATGESITLVFLVTNGTTAYYQTAFQIDGSAVTPKWQGDSAPTAGNASSIDAYTVTIIKTGAATFTALAAQTKFA